MDPLDLNLTFGPPPYPSGKLEENNTHKPELSPRLRTITVPPPQSSPSLSAVPTVEGEKPLRVHPNNPKEVISSPVPLPPSPTERGGLLARPSPMLPTSAVNRYSPPSLSSAVPSSSHSLRGSDLFGRATSWPSPRTYTTTPASVDGCSLFERATSDTTAPDPLLTAVRAVQKPPFQLSPVPIHNFEPGSSSRATDPCVLAAWARNCPNPSIQNPSHSAFFIPMDQLDLSLTLAPSLFHPAELEEKNAPEPDLWLSLGRTINDRPPQSSPPLSAVPTLEGEEPLRFQPRTPEEVISSPFTFPSPPWSSERSGLLAWTSPMNPTSAVNLYSLPPHFSWSPCPSSVLPSSSQEATSLQASDLFGRATAQLSPVTYSTAPAPLSTVMRIKTPTPPSSPVGSQKDYSAVVHTVEPPPTTSTKLHQPIGRLPPPEVPVPSGHEAADIRGFITETKDALLARGIQKISGAIKCKKCRNQSIIDLDLPVDLSEMANFIISNKRAMERGNYSSTTWYYPNLLNCPKCGAIANSKPVLEGSVDHISWLFLFLGKLLGICSRNQLYSYCVSVCLGCKKTERKDDLLLSVFTHILGKLDPEGCPTELPRSIPPTSATLSTPTVSGVSPYDFGFDSSGKEENAWNNPQVSISR